MVMLQKKFEIGEPGVSMCVTGRKGEAFWQGGGVFLSSPYPPSLSSFTRPSQSSPSTHPKWRLRMRSAPVQSNTPSMRPCRRMGRDPSLLSLTRQWFTTNAIYSRFWLALRRNRNKDAWMTLSTTTQCEELPVKPWPNGTPNSSQVYNFDGVGYRLATHLAWVGSNFIKLNFHPTPAKFSTVWPP